MTPRRQSPASDGSAGAQPAKATTGDMANAMAAKLTKAQRMRSFLNGHHKQFTADRPLAPIAERGNGDVAARLLLQGNPVLS
jgi:hypothetical protein